MMDEIIEEIMQYGTPSLDELRWIEHLKDERGEGWKTIDQDAISFLFYNPQFTPDPRRTWRQNYEMYLRSDKWLRTRGIAIIEARNRCVRCGWQADYKGKGLEVHHKTYTRLGNELPEDLEVLCPPCHEIADQERAQQNKRGRT